MHSKNTTGRSETCKYGVILKKSTRQLVGNYKELSITIPTMGSREKKVKNFVLRFKDRIPDML